MKKLFNRILTFYYYIFFCLYRFWAFVNTTEWGASTRAVIAILAIDIWTFFSIFIYFDIRLDNDKLFNMLGIIIISFNLYLFTYKDKWKPYFEKFRKYDKAKRLKLDVISWIIIVGLLVNFVYSVSFYHK